MHLAFIDITKAYDTVDRGLLWSKLEAMNISGKFLSTLQSLYKGDCVTVEVNGESTRPLYPGRGLCQGCSLSPILFALYIRDLGKDLASSGEGFDLSGIIISGILFADDIICIARTAEGLRRLLKLVQSHCQDLRLTVSVDKSQVISPDATPWEVVDGNGMVLYKLKTVEQYKYLGVKTFSSMHRTGLTKQDSTRQLVRMCPGGVRM